MATNREVDNKYEMGHAQGVKEAKQLLKKVKPKTTLTLIRKVQHPLRDKLATDYRTMNKFWKDGWSHGAWGALLEYQTEQLKRQFSGFKKE